MKKLLIIKDFRDWFWSTFPNWEKSVSLNVAYISQYFIEAGCEVEVTSYGSFDYGKDYSEYYVIYSSAEDYCGGTKAFMEDVLVHLSCQGARLLPDFKYFRGHDNKVMMEILRYSFKEERLKSIKSRVWASYEELKEAKITEFPVIVKRAGGAGGEGVFLAHNEKELYKYAELVSRMANRKHFDYMTCVNVKQRLLGKEPALIHNNKFITQNFIQNLTGDYKVLVFGEHYFVLHRLNRENDFRASGSGYFSKDNGSQIEMILDYAKLCRKEIASPWLSLDICCDGSACHLIEFQCLFFGFKAMSMSECHYVEADGAWKLVEGRVVPEQEFCDSLRYFLEEGK